MKVLLVTPPIQAEEVYSKFSDVAPQLPPLGLCYLGTYLINAGFDVRLVDATVEKISFRELGKIIIDENPQVVGVSSTTVSFNSAKQVFKEVKKISPDILTVLGGAHINAAPESTMKECPEIDLGVMGEGEYTFLDVCARYKDGADYMKVPGTIYRSDNRVIFNSPRSLEKNIDKFPIPDRDLLGDLNLYSHTPFRGGNFTVSMISSRGCPHRCTYCDQSVFGKSWRGHSASRVVEEMELIKNKYNADFISFEDDNFLLKKSRTREICYLLCEKNLGLHWGCSVRVNNLDTQILEEMKSAGCRVIYIGIETASQRILELLDRNISLQQVRKGVELVKYMDIKIYGSFILGFPTETRDEITNTIRFSLELPLDGVSYFLFTPYPNIKLRDLALKHGSVSDNWADYSTHPSKLPYIPHDIPAEDLLRYQSLAYRKFFFRWRYIRNHLGMVIKPSFIKHSLGVMKKLVSPVK